MVFWTGALEPSGYDETWMVFSPSAKGITILKLALSSFCETAAKGDWRMSKDLTAAEPSILTSRASVTDPD